MIRPFTLVCMLLACGSGLYLYQAKHRVLMLDRQISTTVQATTAARDRAGMLHAEWMLLNDPERLRALADQHLQLKPLATGQLVSLAELGSRLPPPREAEAEPGPEAETPVVAHQEPAVAPPVQMPALPPSVTVAKATPRPAEHKPAAIRIAAVVLAAPPRSTPPAMPVRAATSIVPTRVMASVAPSPAASAPTYVASISRELVNQIARGKPINASLPMMASALGMARTLLPPPVPFASASAMSRDGN